MYTYSVWATSVSETGSLSPSGELVERGGGASGSFTTILLGWDETEEGTACCPQAERPMMRERESSIAVHRFILSAPFGWPGAAAPQPDSGR